MSSMFRSKTRDVRRPAFGVRGGDESMQRRHRPDYMLIIFSLSLLVIGLIVVYSISPALGARHNVGENYFAGRQLMAIGVGLAAFIAASSVPLNRWKSIKGPLALTALAATAAALALPVSPDYPAPRWIRLGGFSLQSVEVVKFALIIWLAAFIEKRRSEGLMNDFHKTLKPLMIGAVILIILIALLQSDLGSAAVIAAIVAAMVYIGGLPLKRVGQMGLLAAVMMAVLILPFSYRIERVNTYLNPERDCQGSGYQACQAFIAVGSGGLVGKGLASSGQAYGYLPEAANDSIFAIISEKFGFIGATTLIVLLVAFFIRVKNIMERAPNEFSRLIVTGVLAWLSVQSFINIGAMIGLLPLKGITLPFISYGGTSVVFIMAAVGLMFNISRYTTYAVNRGDAAKQKNQSSLRGKRYELFPSSNR